MEYVTEYFKVFGYIISFVIYMGTALYFTQKCYEDVYSFKSWVYWTLSLGMVLTPLIMGCQHKV